MKELLNLGNIIFAAAIIIFLFVIFSRLKRMFTRYTPELFRQKQMEMGIDGYAKWLKKEYGFWQAMFLEKKSRGILASAVADKIKILEQEIENMEKQYGSSLFGGKGKLGEPPHISN